MQTDKRRPIRGSLGSSKNCQQKSAEQGLFPMSKLSLTIWHPKGTSPMSTMRPFSRGCQCTANICHPRAECLHPINLTSSLHPLYHHFPQLNLQLAHNNLSPDHHQLQPRAKEEQSRPAAQKRKLTRTWHQPSPNL